MPSSAGPSARRRRRARPAIADARDGAEPPEAGGLRPLDAAHGAGVDAVSQCEPYGTVSWKMTRYFAYDTYMIVYV